MKNAVPGFIHKCPYNGMDFQARNLILTLDDLALWIIGEYKVSYTFYDFKDELIYQVSGCGIIKRE